MTTTDAIYLLACIVSGLVGWFAQARCYHSTYQAGYRAGLHRACQRLDQPPTQQHTHK